MEYNVKYNMVQEDDGKFYLTHSNCLQAANELVSFFLGEAPILTAQCRAYGIYGVPRGGVPVAYLVKANFEARGFPAQIVDAPHSAHIIVDDLVDSGATKKRFTDGFPAKSFLTLGEFIWSGKKPGWVVFPWEHGNGVDTSADDIVTRLLEYIGEDPKREGLRETPKRVLKAWKEWTRGYQEDPASVLKCFEDGAQNYDEMVVQKDLPFYSMCEHHLAPFFGTATIAYVPTNKVVGLSKLGRVLGIFARRLQVQERLTTQIADTLFHHLMPKGVGVLIKARHLCMESRGIGQQGHYTVTSALRGVFLNDRAARQEFLSIAQQK